jgi:DNA topoisomerase-1
MPEDVRSEVGEREAKLYELIWKRTIACQMAEARVHGTTVHVAAADAVFFASGRTIDFPGFLRAYVEGADDPDAKLADMEKTLPAMDVDDEVRLEALDPKGHATQPPRRYTEAALVKELESNGIGRPSTYASIIETILLREYVVKQGNSLVPTFMAFAVVRFLERNFADLIDIQFTARMEDDLDAISLGEAESQPYLRRFYFGEGEKPGLKQLLEGEFDAREACTIPLGKDAEGRAINVRIGRYGPYLERGEDRAPIPAGTSPDELTLAKAEELLQKGGGPKVLGADPSSGKSVYLKAGRFGPYVQLGENDEEPRMKSLLPGMSPETTSLEDALRLLSLPRTLGADPEKGEPVTVDYGRFGPYVKRGSDTRSVPKDEDIFRLTLERALELLRAEKPARGFRARAATVLRDLGAHPKSGVPVRILEGRYGPYVTDGSLNASLKKDMSPQTLTMEEALALLLARAEAPPRKGFRTARKRSSAPAAKDEASPSASPKEGKAKPERKPPSKAATKKRATGDAEPARKSKPSRVR